MSRIGKSDAQANAEALARRSSTYADEHARSWDVRFDRPTHEPKSLRGYVMELRAAFAGEVPTRLHSRDLDSGGAPEHHPGFAAFLDGSPFATDKDDDSYRSPTRAALEGMHRASDAVTQADARIAYRIACGMSAEEAVLAEPDLTIFAKRIATGGLQKAWRRIISAPLPRRDAVA